MIHKSRAYRRWKKLQNSGRESCKTTDRYEGEKLYLEDVAKYKAQYQGGKA